MTDPLTSLVERLEKATEGSRECILWPRALDKHGRGRIWDGDKLKLAHRWAWERLNGPIPAGCVLCHHCDNPTCVNPAHLYVGTQKDNVRDMMERKRNWQAREPERAKDIARKLGKSNCWMRGAKNPRAKLSAEQVSEIQVSTQPTKILAAAYNVNRTTIQRIRGGMSWTK